MRFINRAGQRFSRLVAIELAYRYNGHSYWLCLCDCGNKTTVSSSNLLSKSKPTKSCGCFAKDKGPWNKTHGLTNTVEHQTWVRLRHRCYSKWHKKYPIYGGRGITVSKSWLNSFEKFLEDMGKRPGPDYSIERINNNKGYSKSNCKWATRSEQMKNRRPYGKKNGKVKGT